MAFLRLAGIETDLQTVRTDDITINLPEHRADQVLLLDWQRLRGRKALHLEFQLRPDRQSLQGWFLKNAALTAQLGAPVALLALYLTRGRYRTFPSSYEAEVGNLNTEFRFDTLRLWEHRERIRGGELPELAPLLVLCHDNPEEQILEEERRLILGLAVPQEVRSDLLAVAVTVGTRYFGREVVLMHFREELQMLRGASFIEDWVKEGRAEGRAEGTRELLLQLLEDQFGPLPTSVVDRVNKETPRWCRETALRLRKADSLADLGL